MPRKFELRTTNKVKSKSEKKEKGRVGKYMKYLFITLALALIGGVGWVLYSMIIHDTFVKPIRAMVGIENGPNSMPQSLTVSLDSNLPDSSHQLLEQNLSQKGEEKIIFINNKGHNLSTYFGITSQIQITATYQSTLIEDEWHQYLVPVMYYWSLADSINSDNLEEYTVATLDSNQPLLENYLESTEISPVTRVYTNDDTGVAELYDYLKKSDKGGKKALAFLRPSQLDSRFKVISWNGTHLLNELTTQHPTNKPAALIFALGANKYKQISESQQKSIDQITQELGKELMAIAPPFGRKNLASVRMTGVTAISRNAAVKTNASGDPSYMAGKIGDFLADADLTHTSNEVSFVPNCQPSNGMKFCSHPNYIKALEESGIDIVELTGNHNNDYGAKYNTETIKTYKEKGWEYFGGGLNRSDAEKILYQEVKGTTIAFIGYNYYDTILGTTALAGDSRAGANSYSESKMKSDIAKAREKADVVIVDFQFVECWLYTDDYSTNPVCYKPITSYPQQEIFRKAVDFGADIVVGTQAHQPQTFENYKGKMIYYGLGNLYFDQTPWYGSRQGLVLTHYFHNGKYLNTMVTTTLYDKDLRPYVTEGEERLKLMKALK